MDIVHVCLNNKEVLIHNNRNIVKVGNPIALVELKNTGNAKSMNNKNFGNSSLNIYLCIGEKVALIRNHLNAGLLNSSVGIIKEIIFDPNKPAPALPKFVLVDFRE